MSYEDGGGDRQVLEATEGMAKIIETRALCVLKEVLKTP
jgi:hypothetical protein